MKQALSSTSSFSSIFLRSKGEKVFSIFSRKPKTHRIAVITNPSGTFELAVVGERHYQKVLAEICGSPTERGHRFETDAYLVPENDNPYDSNAVKVMIDGKHVGYLDREAACGFRKVFSKIVPSGTIVKCPALIQGGWDRGEGDRGPFGVKLDLPYTPRIEFPEVGACGVPDHPLLRD